MLTSPVSLGLSLDVTEGVCCSWSRLARPVGVLWDGTTLCPGGTEDSLRLRLVLCLSFQSVLVIGRIAGEKGGPHLETKEAYKILHQAPTGGDLRFPSSLHYHSRSGVEPSLWSAEGEGPALPLWFSD